MTITLKPLSNNVWIRKDEQIKSTPGGLHLPDVCQDPAATGEVLEVGPGRINSHGTRDPMELSVGQKVLFPKYRGTNAKIDGKDFFLIPETEIAVVLE